MRRGKIIKGFLLYRILKRLPLFPFIPIAPGALLIGSFVTAIRALRRVKRLEQQVAATPA
jgi:hypothetical protein